MKNIHPSLVHIYKNLAKEKLSPSSRIPYADLARAVEHIDANLALQEPLDIESATDRYHTVLYTALGGSYVHPFGNMYAISGHPDKESVEAMNMLKGRPGNQLSSATTSPSNFQSLFDLDRVPKELGRANFLELLDALSSEVGVFGVRGPANAKIKETHPHFITDDPQGIPNIQLIAVGRKNNTNHALIDEYHGLFGNHLHSITSANVSSNQTGEYEAAHYKRTGMMNDLSHIFPIITIIDKTKENKSLEEEWKHLLPVSTSVLSLHYTAEAPDGSPALVLDREGSASFSHIEAIVTRTTNNKFHLVRGKRRRSGSNQEHINPILYPVKITCI